MQIIIQGQPIAQQRGKISTRGGFPRLYSEQASKKRIMRAVIEHDVKRMGIDLEAYFSLPIKLVVSFYMKIPDSLSKAQKNAKLWNTWHDVKPDIDNLQKWVLDLLKDIAFKDDAQIVEIYAVKKYSENPCTIIDIITINLDMNDDCDKMTKVFSPVELENLEYEIMYLATDLQSLRLNCRETRLVTMQNAAKSLIDFASKYANNLKKLAKK